MNPIDKLCISFMINICIFSDLYPNAKQKLLNLKNILDDTLISSSVGVVIYCFVIYSFGNRINTKKHEIHCYELKGTTIETQQSK